MTHPCLRNIGHAIRKMKDPKAAPSKAEERRLRTQSALLCRSRHRGDHTRPGCRFPRPRGKPCAPGRIKRSCKFRAHCCEPQGHATTARNLRFHIPHLCSSLSICGSKTQSNPVQPWFSGWRQLGATSGPTPLRARQTIRHSSPKRA